MEIRAYLEIARRRWWLIFLGIVVAGGAGILAGALQQPVYRATSTLLVQNNDADTTSIYGALQASERLAQTYAERLRRGDEVLRASAANLGVAWSGDELRQHIQVEAIAGTPLIELSVESADPRTARDLANEIPLVFAEWTQQQRASLSGPNTRLEEEVTAIQATVAAVTAQLPEPAVAGEAAAARKIVPGSAGQTLLERDAPHWQAASVSGTDGPDSTIIGDLIVDDAADLPQKPIRPRILRNNLLMILLGAFLGASAAALAEYADDTIRGPDTVARLVDRPVLGIIPRLEGTQAQEKLIDHPNHPPATIESYRQLRTNIKHALDSGRLKSLLIASPGAAEGKTTTAANLALVLAQGGNRVILVDANLREPSLHRLFGGDNLRGLSTLVALAGATPAAPLDQEVLQATGVTGLRLLSSGALPRDPAALLGEAGMARAATWLSEQADYVIYDSPPLLSFTDAAVLSNHVDTALVVLHAAKTREQAVVSGWENLLVVGTDIAGVLLNRVTRREMESPIHHHYRHVVTGPRHHAGTAPEAQRPPVATTGR